MYKRTIGHSGHKWTKCGQVDKKKERKKEREKEKKIKNKERKK